LKPFKSISPTILLLFAVVTLSFGQSGISLYHLNNATFQANNMNPAFMPDGKIFLGIPVLSGITLDYNNRVSYNDLVTTNELGNLEWDFGNFVSQAKGRNWLSLEGEVSTFYIGIRPTATQAFSFFIRERFGARGFYTDDVVDFAWNGNAQFVDQKVDIGSTLIDVRYYREYGIGYWKSLPNRGINFGVRFKFLNGMVSAVTEKGMSGTVFTEADNFQTSFDLDNVALNTSGQNIFETGDDLVSHLISNGNIGFGIDLGLHWKINKNLSAAVSVTDLGYINWKVDPENFSVLDTTFRYEGVDLQDLNQIGDVLQDSLVNRFQDTTTNVAFKTGLNTNFYGSLIYQLSEKDQLTATVANQTIRGKWRMLYGIGYTRKFGKVLVASANLTQTAQYGLDFGLATAVNLGTFQFYIASDKLIRVWDVPNAKAFDLRFGINFIFGRGKNEQKDDRSDLQHPSGFADGEKIEKSDGIYWIIKKQNPQPLYEKKKFKNNSKKIAPKIKPRSDSEPRAKGGKKANQKYGERSTSIPQKAKPKGGSESKGEEVKRKRIKKSSKNK